MPLGAHAQVRVCPRTPGGHRSTTWKPQHVLGPVWTHRAGSRRVGPSGLCPNGPSVLGIRTHLRSAALQGSLPASRKTAGFSKAASHRVRQPSVPYSVAMEQSLHHNHSRPPPPTIVERPAVSFSPVAPQRLSTPMTCEDCLGSFEKDRSVQALYRLWTQGPGHRAMVFSRSSSR